MKKAETHIAKKAEAQIVKKLTKRAFALLLCFALLAAVFPVPSLPTAAKTSGDYEYSVIDETAKTCEITGYTGSGGDVVIPSTLDDYTVTEIGDYAFQDRTSLTSVTIPDSVTYVGDSAFGGCTSLTSVTIPDSVTIIDWYAFYKCTSLTSVTIGNSVTTIDSYAFCNCTSLTSVTIPDSVTEIGYEAFRGCTSLTSVTIGNSVTSIGWGAFADCTSLTSVTMGNGVTTIGSDAFENTAYYNNSANWTGDVLYLGKWLIKAKDTLSGAYEIKSGTVGIADYAFFGCTSLTSVTIPDSVTEIVEYAFSHCSSLRSVTIPDSVTEIGYRAFYNGDFAFYNGSYLTDVYYTGTEAQWQAITIGSDNNSLLNATRHYNSSGPDDLLKSSHIVRVDFGELGKRNDLQYSLDATISIYFDQDLDIEATNNSPGTMQLWAVTDGGDRLIRTIESLSSPSSPKVAYYSVGIEDPKRVDVSVYVGLLHVWKPSDVRATAIPYGAELYLLIDENAIVFKDPNISFCGVKAKAKSLSVRTPWGLTPDIDYLPFSNSIESEFFKEIVGFNDDHYDVGKRVEELLYFRTQDKKAKRDIEKKIEKDEWHGSCLGMCSVMALAKSGRLNVSAWDKDAKNCYELDFPKDSKDDFGTRDLINYYQLLQFLSDYPEHNSFKNKFTNSCNSGEKWKDVVQTIINKAQAFQETKTPLIVNMTFKYYNSDEDKNEDFGHSCLAFSYENVEGRHRVYLYDPSAPTIKTYLEIDGDFNVNINGYKLKDGSPCELKRIAYVLPEDLGKYNIDSLAEDAKKASGASDLPLRAKSLNSRAAKAEAASEEDYSLICFPINGTYTVTNGKGETITCADGDFSGTMPIYDLRVLGEGTTAEYEAKVDKSEKFVFSSVADRADFAVFQDGCYQQAETEKEGTTTTVMPGKALTIGGLDGANYKICADINTDAGDMIFVEGFSVKPVSAVYNEDGAVSLIADNIPETKLTVFNKLDVTETNIDDSQPASTVSAADSAVIYDANGGTGAPSAQTKQNGVALTLSTATPTRAGFDFLGWATSATAAAALYQPGDSYGEDADATLYAVWSKQAPQKGDINGDGEVDNLDAAVVLQYDAGLIDATESMLAAGDVNADGEVDNLDAAMILQYDAGLIEGF